MRAATIKDAIAVVISISLVVYAGAEVIYIAYKTNDDLHKLDEASNGGSTSVGRMDLAGKKHPVSGVEFDSNGFPIFESKYSMQLNPEDYLKSRGTHFDRASKALYNDIMKDSNLRSQFTDAEIAIFKEGGVPKAYTWHHHQDAGKMQLVNRKIHRQTGHTGGFSIWGPGN
ncbi:HNH endonuclease [Clostridium bornimense]|uniref:HNH endonuclease n=1 Tax=Clostridium bornimense TaxID=1216932 RepID=UPI001C0F8449|nr:HNH endonuclease [Clostridium bornimense]